MNRAKKQRKGKFRVPAASASINAAVLIFGIAIIGYAQWTWYPDLVSIGFGFFYDLSMAASIIAILKSKQTAKGNDTIWRILSIPIIGWIQCGCLLVFISLNWVSAKIIPSEIGIDLFQGALIGIGLMTYVFVSSLTGHNAVTNDGAFDEDYIKKQQRQSGYVRETFNEFANRK